MATGSFSEDNRLASNGLTQNPFNSTSKGGSAISGEGYLERLYRTYQETPDAIDPLWQKYFSLFSMQTPKKINSSAHIANVTVPSQWFEKNNQKGAVQSEGEGQPHTALIEHCFREYTRKNGYLAVATDPLETASALCIDDFFANFLETLPTQLHLDAVKHKDDLIAFAQKTYCNSIAIEGLTSQGAPWQKWLINEVESTADATSLQQHRARVHWDWLQKAERFETFLHKKFVGQKRFSLEGHESLIPALHVMLEEVVTAFGCEEVFLGMAHRGRLNVLAHVLSKPYGEIIEEFMDRSDFPRDGGGDVKYHMGRSASLQYGADKKRRVHVHLCPNPSHLEAVNPVVLGMAYAKAVELGGAQKVLPILIHGDAAFSGQGVVYESMQLMRINGYRCGGAIHIILNNQIGFTATPNQSRSTPHCSDLAHTFNCPVFRVNAQDMCSIAKVISWASTIRALFACDVLIDLVGYRRWGHNESDEPRYTQPKMYKKIDQIQTAAKCFDEACLAMGYEFNSEKMQEKLQEELEKSFVQAQQKIGKLNKDKSSLSGDAVAMRDSVADSVAESRGVALFQKTLRSTQTIATKQNIGLWAQGLWGEKVVSKGILKAVSNVDGEFRVHRKIAQLMQQRLEKVLSGKGLDWGCCELLAYSSILSEGHSVRLSGQDSARGTFSHRHLEITDQNSDARYNLLTPFINSNAIEAKKSLFAEVFSSALSEYAVLGFEYGVSQIRKNALTIWEAQFGDFCNGAQIVIDQFLSSAQSKWGATSRLVLFLPHGYEGQGPEHSSARIERFLALSSQANWSVCQLSAPAQLFHLLRRQVLTSAPSPLVLFTPKALLRHRRCISEVEDLTQKSFQEVIFHPSKLPPRALVLSSGKIFYDIDEHCPLADDIALASIEQLYPLPVDIIKGHLEKHPSIKEVIWIQEEPVNMGPMTWIRSQLWPQLQERYRVRDLGRPRSSSTATGYAQAHQFELKSLLGCLKEMLYKA